MPIEVLLATTNPGKIQEFKILLGRDVSLDIPSSKLEVEELGSTYEANALLKAKAFFDRFGKPTLSDDSGLEVEGLSGRPGIHSARYGGSAITWEQRWNFLLAELNGKNRNAKFICVLCYYDGVEPQYFRGEVAGKILDAPEGTQGFGYDPLFFSSELKKSFGVASEGEKSCVSHRSRACQRFVGWLSTLPVA